MINMDSFTKELTFLLDKLLIDQSENIKKTAEICANSIKNNGVIHVFGSGHSVGFGIEMSNQIGSLIPIHTIETTDFVLKKQVSLEQFKSQDVIFERTPNIANKLYDLYDIHKEDVFIIISNSGINGLVIDLADIAKKNNHKVIVITSYQHTFSEDSRHPSGKKLYEFGDVVIDNCGPKGDALIDVGDIKICSVSSITGAYIAQSLTSEILDILLSKNVELPIILEEIDEFSINHNKKIFEKYKGRI